MLHIVFIVIGLMLLVVGGDSLLKSSVGLSLKMNIPRMIVGLTVVSFATSAPELIVSVNAALNGHSDMAIGNVIGSNISNITLVLGLSLLFGSIQVGRSFFRSDWPVMMLVSVVLFLMMYFDKGVSRLFGGILFAGLILFIWYLFKFQSQSIDTDEVSDEDSKMSIAKIILLLSFGIVGLWLGSELLIRGSEGLAKSLGVSERIISITIISVGTSIPELVTSVVAMVKKEKAISIGNIIGSNIFNILAVLGITSMVSPINKIDPHFLSRDVYWMLFSALQLLLLVLLFKGRKLNWRQGVIMLLSYVVFVYYVIL